MISIDFDSHIPYYAQLIEIIKTKIDQKVWNPGDQIPGEPELCKLYGISRTVVRQALSEMEQDGLIERRKGKGTYIAMPKISEGLAQKLTGFYQDMVSRGYTPITQVLLHHIVEATPKIASELEIQAGSPVFEIKRLRSVDDTPIHVVTSYIPQELCPKLAYVDLTNRSLYDFLERECGLLIVRGRRYIEAVLANEIDARLLMVDRGAPLIYLESNSYLENGSPIEYYIALYRGDRSRFEIELVRTHAHPRDALQNIAHSLPDSNSGLTLRRTDEEN